MHSLLIKLILIFTLILAEAVVEPTKRSLRVQTWRKLKDNKLGVGYNAIFNRIPGFVDADKAAALLIETEEFKKASKFTRPKRF